MSTTEPTEDRVYVRADALRSFIAELFASEGLPPDDALTVADCLVRANLRGIDTQGVFRVPTYLKRLRAGLNNMRPDIAVSRVGLAAAHVDGDCGRIARHGRGYPHRAGDRHGACVREEL